MSFVDDLLEQADHLASRERRKPKQASLRRAVSSAYYALFHLLVEDAASSLVSGDDLRRLVARAFEHSEMKKAAAPFKSGNLPSNLATIAGNVVPSDLKVVAAAFVDLQDARHSADYDLASQFSRLEVQAHIQQARNAVAAWRRIRGQQIARVFLAALLLFRRWDR